MPEHFDDGQRLRGECLVQFDQIDLVEGEAGQLERLGDGVHRPDAHFLWKASGVGEGHEARQRFDAQLAARSSDITTAAAAPSDICEVLPAVTVPSA